MKTLLVVGSQSQLEIVDNMMGKLCGKYPHGSRIYQQYGKNRLFFTKDSNPENVSNMMKSFNEAVDLKINKSFDAVTEYVANNLIDALKAGKFDIRQFEIKSKAGMFLGKIARNIKSAF